MSRDDARTEVACPNCAAPLVVAASSRRKKIQCPRCREVVQLSAPAEPPPAASAPAPAVPGPTAEEFAELKARVERQAVLIEKLLARVMPREDLPPGPPGGESLLAPGTALRWLRRPAGGARDIDEEQESVLLHNLRIMGQREIVVHTAPADPPAQRRVERLTAVFREAGWTVQGADRPSLEQPARGLILAAGQCPLPKAATATYMALKAAGFSIDSKLDPALRPDQSVLIMGS